MSIESKEILDLHSIYHNLQEAEDKKLQTCADGTKKADCSGVKGDDSKESGNTTKKKSGFNVSIPLPGFLKNTKINLTGNKSGEKPGVSKVDNDNGKKVEIQRVEDPKKDEIKKDEVKKDEIKKDEVKKDEVKKDEVKKDEIKKDEIKKDEIKKDEVKKDEIKKVEVKKEKPDLRSDAQKKVDSLGKMSNLEKKNRLRFGNDKIDFLKQKQKDFKTMQAMSQMPDADRGKEKLKFINKYPNSITAQKYHGLRDHLEWDAFDMVGSYLMDSKQAESMDEALYVMMEMDSNTIQSIVRDSEFELIEARRADKKGIKRGEKGNPDTDQAPSGQQAANTLTGSKARRVERREGDKRRKANKERRGYGYGGKEAAAGSLANAQRQPDADLGSQKQVTDTGAHKNKAGYRQRVSSPASGRKSEGAMSDREDKRYPPRNPKHKLHGKKTMKDKPQGRYKEVKENYAAVESIRRLIEKHNNKIEK